MADEDVLDTIVIGGSAGAFDALLQLLPLLPEDLPAVVLVCLHQSPTAPSRAASLLSTHSRLPVAVACDGAPLRSGSVLLAPPDRHMMIGHDHVHLRRGAHENNFRPAIDPLFRSAAVYRGPRAAGVVLSGLLDDGAAGARALARTGGTVLIQSPDDARFPDMPSAALSAVPDSETLTLTSLAERLRELAGSPRVRAAPVPTDIGIELTIASLEGASMANEERLGTLSPYNCPHCNGVLWEIEDGPLLRFRCHTGHAYTMDALGAAQEEALDRGLFDALRAHRGRAALVRRMAERGEVGDPALVDRAARIEEDAERLENIIRARGGEAVERRP